MTKLTVGEVARRIKDEDESIEAVTHRLRSWTKEGVLKPLGDKRPGTGKRLHYSERSLIDAAILSRLARHYGIWATGIWATKVLPAFAEAVDKAAKQLPKVKAAAELDPAKVVYLIVGTRHEGKNLRVESRIQYVDDPWRSRRPKDGLPKRSLELSPFMSDGLFIDLTSLFERIGVPLAEAEALKKLAKEYPGIELIKRG
jgi:hypothetical protein